MDTLFAIYGDENITLGDDDQQINEVGTSGARETVSTNSSQLHQMSNVHDRIAHHL